MIFLPLQLEKEG